jgi:hypothetical protein
VRLRSIYGIGGWDATPLESDISKQRRHFGVADWAPRTVTVDGNVYYAHEVNYFFWGFMNAQANKKGARASKEMMVEWIYYYRFAADPAYCFTEHDGTKAGRAAWARAGWDYAMTGELKAPTAIRLPGASATEAEYAGFLGFGTFQVTVGGEIIPLRR